MSTFSNLHFQQSPMAFSTELQLRTQNKVYNEFRHAIKIILPSFFYCSALKHTLQNVYIFNFRFVSDQNEQRSLTECLSIHEGYMVQTYRQYE
jgi:hypothetical protein